LYASSWLVNVLASEFLKLDQCSLEANLSLGNEAFSFWFPQAKLTKRLAPQQKTLKILNSIEEKI
jgi:hypothetical protein